MRWPERYLIVGGLMAALCLADASSRAKGLKPPAMPDQTPVDEWIEAHSDAAVVSLQTWTGFDVQFRRRQNGLVGTATYVEDYVVRDRTALEEASTIVTFDEPAQRLRKLQVLVISGGQTDKYDRDDLRWIEMTRRKDGVVTLDGTISYTMIPNLRPGDRVRITIEYEIKGIHGLGQWALGDPNVASLSAALELRVPQDYVVAWGVQASADNTEWLRHTQQAKKGRVLHRWELDASDEVNAPHCRSAYRSATITPHIEHAGRDHADDMAVGADWESVGQSYLSAIDGVYESDRDMNQHVEQITADVGEDPGETIDRIYTAVQGSCRYLGLFEGRGGIIPVEALEVFKLGFGDCKGLGTLLIAMLRAAEIEAYPVLVRTRSAGPLDTSVPDMAQFNHYIVWADDGEGGIFLDGTVDFCPAGRVPAEDAGSPVLLLKPGEIGLVDIPRQFWESGDSRLELSGQLREGALLNLEVELGADKNTAWRWRNRVARLDQRKSNKLILEWLLPQEHPMRSSNVEVFGMDDWQLPISIRVTASSRAPLPQSANEIFLSKTMVPIHLQPPPLPTCGWTVDLSSYSPRHERWNLDLPAGFVLADEDSVEFADDGIRWKRRVWQEGSTLHLERSIEFTDAVISPEQADIMRTTMAVALQAESGYFVLRRE